MNLQVESLKVLVTRQVVMNRMDYSTFLSGTVKDELNGLDRLAGKFRVQASKLTIEGLHGGKMLPQDDWDYSTNTISCTHLDIVHSFQYRVT